MFDQVDWNEVWKRKMAMLMDRYKVVNDFNDDSYDTPSEYDLAVKRNDWEIGRALISKINFSKDSRVLDIGPGPGTIAVPLSKMVKSITAVEPSLRMLDLLKKNVKRYGSSNVNYLQKTWEEVDIEKDLDVAHDVVISSFSLMMLDLRSALLKFNCSSEKYVHIFWSTGETSFDKQLARIWPKISGLEYISAPGTELVYYALCDMGICPNIEYSKMKFTFSYNDFEMALNSFKQMYHCFPKNDSQEQTLVRFLKKVLIARKEGYVLEYPVSFSNVWWDVRGFEVEG